MKTIVYWLSCIGQQQDHSFLEYSIKTFIDKKVDPSFLIGELMNHGATYCSITLLDKKGVSYFCKTSNEYWLNLYINENLYQKCHLMNEASNQIKNNKKGFVFLWDNYFPNNEESKYLDSLRKEKNIYHGVAFCSPLDNGCKSIITITGKNSDINFSTNVLRNKNIVYQAIMKSLVSC